MFGLDFLVDMGRAFTLHPDMPTAATKYVGKLSWQIMSDRFWRDMGELGKWKDLKPETWARKSTDKMLVETGAYYKSWDMLFPAVDAVTIESKSKLAPFHEFGTKNMPERSWVWLGDGEAGFIAERLADWIEAQVDRD